MTRRDITSWLPAPRHSFALLAGDAQAPATEVLFALGHHLVAARADLVGPFVADVPAEVAARDLILARPAGVLHLLARGAPGRGERKRRRDQRAAGFSRASHPCARTSTSARPTSPGCRRRDSCLRRRACGLRSRDRSRPRRSR